MSVLGPSEIKSLLNEAAESLSQPGDREVMDRLVASINATDILEWDRRLIATMLAKAGKVGEAKRVINGIPTDWEKADALRSAGVALVEANQENQGLDLLQAATECGITAQEVESDQDRQCAAGVLADIAEFHATRGKYDDSEKVIEAIADPIRQQRALDRLRELRGDVPEPREDY